MSEVFKNIKLPLDASLKEKLEWLSPGFSDYRILRKSVDARSQEPYWVYSVEVFAPGESPPHPEFHLKKIALPSNHSQPIIIGTGPAGLFAALRLAEQGIPCQLFERGSRAQKRIINIAKFWRNGNLDTNNNVCFGEGGAGLYSDGKLITRIKSPHIPYVLNRLVKFGAPKEIEYLANPHVGSDKIRKLIPFIREYLESLGCTFHFNAKVSGLLYERNKVTGVKLEDETTFTSKHVILATGHSAQDMILHLESKGVEIEGKSFAIGLRIEHPQQDINKIQYKNFAQHPDLGAANYRLTNHDAKTGVGVYSFCMCPGGYVISSGTEESGVVSNGMSNFARNAPFANAAIVVTMDHEKWFGKNKLGGLELRSQLEIEAKKMAGGSHHLPSQKVSDFLNQRNGSVLKSSCPSGVTPARLDQLLPSEIYHSLATSLERFNQKMPGFISPKAQLHGIESRTSCPIRIPRDATTLESTSHQGLYPTGEGAGYAGGITSAAVDGVRVAEAIVESML